MTTTKTPARHDYIVRDAYGRAEGRFSTEAQARQYVGMFPRRILSIDRRVRYAAGHGKSECVYRQGC